MGGSLPSDSRSLGVHRCLDQEILRSPKRNGMAAFPLAYSLPLFLGSLPFVTVPPLDAVFWWSFAVSIPLNCVSFYLYMAAIRVSPLSLTLPFLSFTPVFMILTGFLVLGEVPSPWAVAGMLAVVLGGYLLNAPSMRHGLLGALLGDARRKKARS